MHKIGLKLYSTNEHYLRDAANMRAKGYYDFVELLPVPGTYKTTIAKWKSFPGPFIIHAPHFSFGVNLGSKESFNRNMEVAGETRRFADELKARFIIYHPGMESDIHETARQFKVINDPRVLVENKPYKTMDGRFRCIGGSVREIELVRKESGVGFCLDISHAISYAQNTGHDWYDYLRMFLALGPDLFHVTDGDLFSGKDTHEHIGKGNYDWACILPLIPPDAMVTLETRKDSPVCLSDFQEDVANYRKLVAGYLGTDRTIIVRRAREDDKKAVFELSNDPEVRRYSINKEAISWEEHVEWFSARIKDPESDFLVAEAGGKFVAQARYKPEGSRTVVSLSIVGAFRGKGLSTEILKESARQVFAAHKGLQAITAYIDAANTASVRSFEKAGYIPDGSENVGGRMLGRYILERKALCA